MLQDCYFSCNGQCGCQKQTVSLLSSKVLQEGNNTPTQKRVAKSLEPREGEPSLLLPLLLLGKSQTNLLIIQSTSPSSRVSKFCDCVSELLVEGVPQGPRDPLPSQDQDDNNSILAVVAGTVPHQAQQFLLHVVPPDDLECKQRCWLVQKGTPPPPTHTLLFLWQAGLPPWTRQLGKTASTGQSHARTKVGLPTVDYCRKPQLGSIGPCSLF